MAGGVLRVCSHCRPPALSAPPDWRPQSPHLCGILSSLGRACHHRPLQPALSSCHQPVRMAEKMLKKQCHGIGEALCAELENSVALGTAGGKVRAQLGLSFKNYYLRRPVSPQHRAGCTRWVSVSHLPALPPSSARWGQRRRWAHHGAPAAAAGNFHTPMNGLGRGMWSLWHIFPNQNKAGKSNFRPGLVWKWYQ